MQPTRIDLLELDIDLRLTDLWREAAEITEWNLEVVSAFMRAAYGKGYCDALTEDAPGSLCLEHGYDVPKRRAATPPRRSSPASSDPHGGPRGLSAIARAQRNAAGGPSRVAVVRRRGLWGNHGFPHLYLDCRSWPGRPLLPGSSSRSPSPECLRSSSSTRRSQAAARRPSPSELATKTGEVSLAGRVVGAPTGDAHGAGMRFVLEDIEGANKQRVTVLYKGSVPDLFRTGRDVVVTGTQRPNGLFVTTPGSMITKCPSKYQAAESAVPFRHALHVPGAR